ncbi:hypothetical protein NQ314_007042 [Rhamnusium bicolor]|uniref:Uncharacterized protein n=1 Tax=Rhamnusium bicolor TaxID=1586634 RepID=A0AAV8YT62_9CUCU|nr:hypothetical protein NQ314_007042 [Rhamnusium bicolor]
MVKGISCLDPSIFETKSNVAESRMDTVLETFYSKNIICSQVAENAKNQFKQFVRMGNFKDYKNNERRYIL